MKKYSIFILHIAFTVGINGSLNGMRITQPYTPGNYTIQKPVNVVRSLIHTPYTITHFSPEGIHYALKAGIGTTTPCIQNKQAYYLLDSLLTNPMTVLNVIEQKRTIFNHEPEIKIKNCKNLHEWMQVYKDSVQKYKSNFPLFLLDECPSPCPLGRQNNPHFRAIFEDRVSSLLINKIEALNVNKAIHYASFGSAGSFSEFVIIAKALAKKPNANLHIHLIDLQYACYVAIKEKICTSHEITTDQNVSFETLQQVIRSHATAHNIPFEELEKRSIKTFVSLEEHFKQFIQFLQYTFPKATLKLSIHSAQSNYCHYIQQENLPYADVLASVDILDSFGYKQKAHIFFTHLCLEALKNNPNASNLWLERDYNKEDGNGLITISLNKLHDNSVAIASESGDKVFGYKTVESF